MAILSSLIMPALMLAGALLARRNVRMGRGDRRGAFRAAAVIFIGSLLASVLGASHVADPGVEIGRTFAAIGALFDAAVLWLTYLGLEPTRRGRLRSLLHRRWWSARKGAAIAASLIGDLPID
ncbi:MAG: hypothetical protein LC804_01440 [Acidobacteria bacterium]|nr:hypothetical protein [Acidobacteriota bacterium]